MPEKLQEMIAAVVNEETFLGFVRALEKQQSVIGTVVARLRSGLPEQGNQQLHIADFLHSAGAWAERSRFGRAEEMQRASDWQRFAYFLYAGTLPEES